MKKRRRVTLPNGAMQSIPEDLSKKLGLNYLKLTNKTNYAGAFDLPSLTCNTSIIPDYIALYTQPGYYHKTPLTAVGFWLYDETFDDYDGLYNAIYYNLEERLAFYKQRFNGVKIFFTPDYSQTGDMDVIEQLVRLKKARVIGLWLAEELDAVVIPFITAALPDMMAIALDGLESCHVVAFSTKGYVTNEYERNILKELVKLSVDKLDLHTIVVYDVCSDDTNVEDIFAYAINRKIKVVVPANSLKDSNVRKAKSKTCIQPPASKQEGGIL